MPTRHGGMLAKRASTWPRDHFCRSTIAPRSSWPTTWNEFLPISMPITTMAPSNFWDMACSLSLAPLPSILSLVGQEHAMSQKFESAIAVIGIDIGKNSFHVVGHDERGAIVLRQKWSRGQVEARFANMPPCLVGMEACVGAHHLSRKLNSLGHDARLMPAKYVRPYSKGQKNDFRDAEAIAEAVQRPTMKFVATKTCLLYTSDAADDLTRVDLGGRRI